jgi:hypothetical protein
MMAQEILLQVGILGCGFFVVLGSVLYVLMKVFVSCVCER